MDNLRIVGKKIIIDIQTRFFDYDGSQHLNNSSYLNYMELARYNIFLNHFHTDYRTHFGVVKNIRIDYLRPARIGTEISVSLEFLEVEENNALMELIVFNKNNPDKVFATSRCVQVVIDSKTQRPTPFPENVMAGIRSHIEVNH
jgi:YbgC/YbaW family acyl-CoA thioester hydrolase